MKALDVQFIGENLSNIDVWDDYFPQLTVHKVDQISWASYPYLPHVNFKIAYSISHIFLAFYVEERHLKAVYRETNQPVYKDSCVEFFLSFDGKSYYNLEFNSVGTTLVGYGTSDRDSRRHLPVNLIEKIQTRSVINPSEAKKGEGVHWNLDIQIPLEIFYTEQPLALQGRICYGNFYKCGDDLPEPHFVSWNKIQAPEPNFHLPEHFGEIEFV